MKMQTACNNENDKTLSTMKMIAVQYNENDNCLV